MNVMFKHQSLNREFELSMEAQTTRNVTGKLQTVNWQIMKEQWPHLKDIPFPSTGGKKKIY
ncbi:hypothetical protein DPMN_157094 [Dreissena polymorpha]|uniref:Uncharacterized protein n=1 Tax=Dreissena polymorpha TaxID=45954 RepID=A0A9D4EH92_DREPO|nr:hypothetical protein DPMN_157094 [Dreissena polymorpha]